MSPNQPLIAWAPDADPTMPGVIAEAEQMLPTQRGYAPDFVLQQSVFYPHVLPAAPRGNATMAIGTNGLLPLVGTQSAIYSLTPLGGFANITRVTPAYTAVANRGREGWRFASFGETALAVSFNNQLQETAGAEGGVPFTDISGAPAAACIAAQSEFVMLANFPSTASWPYGDGWWCCATGDPTDWVLDAATFCAQGRLTQTPGPILRLMAYQGDIIAFKAGSILRGRFTGQTSAPWAWSVVSHVVGIVGHDAVCEADNGVLYFLGRDGFYAFNGAAPQRIASAPFEWLQDKILSVSNVMAGWDSVRRCVRFLYTRAILSEVTDQQIFGGVAYHIETDRWGPFETTAQAFLTLPFDDVPLVGSPTVARRLGVPAIINGVNRQVQTWRGSGATATLTTGDVGDDDAALALTKVRLRNMVHGRPPATISAQHLHRMNLDQALTTGETSFGSDGKYDFSQASRWHRVRFMFIGMLEVFGFRVRAPKSGER